MSQGQANSEILMGVLTKEEKEDLITKKMEEMKRRNELLKQRHAEIEAEKRRERESQKKIKDDEDDWSMDKHLRSGRYVDEDDEWQEGGSGHQPKQSTNEEGNWDESEDKSQQNQRHSERGRGRGRLNASRGRQNEGQGHIRGTDENVPLNRSMPPKSPSDSGPPPDPSYRFLSDNSRDFQNNRYDDFPVESDRGSRRHPNNYGGRDFKNVRGQMRNERGRGRGRGSPRSKADMEMTMTGKERSDYSKWKKQRDEIDQQRINRHKHSTTGNWKREWDKEKVDADYQHEEPTSPSQTEPARRPDRGQGQGRGRGARGFGNSASTRRRTSSSGSDDARHVETKDDSITIQIENDFTGGRGSRRRGTRGGNSSKDIRPRHRGPRSTPKAEQQPEPQVLSSDRKEMPQIKSGNVIESTEDWESETINVQSDEVKQEKELIKTEVVVQQIDTSTTQEETIQQDTADTEPTEDHDDDDEWEDCEEDPEFYKVGDVDDDKEAADVLEVSKSTDNKSINDDSRQVPADTTLITETVPSGSSESVETTNEISLTVDNEEISKGKVSDVPTHDDDTPVQKEKEIENIDKEEDSASKHDAISSDIIVPNNNEMEDSNKRNDSTQYANEETNEIVQSQESANHTISHSEADVHNDEKEEQRKTDKVVEDPDCQNDKDTEDQDSDKKIVPEQEKTSDETNSKDQDVEKDIESFEDDEEIDNTNLTREEILQRYKKMIKKKNNKRQEDNNITKEDGIIEENNPKQDRAKVEVVEKEDDAVKKRSTSKERMPSELKLDVENIDSTNPTSPDVLKTPQGLVHVLDWAKEMEMEDSDNV